MMVAAKNPSPFAATANGVRVAVRVTPKASREAIEGIEVAADGGAWLKVRVTAPADKGKANEAARRLLAKAWGVARRDLTLVAGATARHKQFVLAGNPAAELARLQHWLEEQDR